MISPTHPYVRMAELLDKILKEIKLLRKDLKK